MKIQKETLIHELENISNQLIYKVKQFQTLSENAMNYKANENAWSLLECLEHLNLYGDFYLPELESQILKAKISQNPQYNPGVLGNYFAKIMKYNEFNMKKMKSPKDKNPKHSLLNTSVLNRFLKQSERLLNILELSKQVDLGKTKCAISISPFIKLKLGDTLRFYIYHMERHVIQAEKTQK
jgi:hypothetical protein